ncbi:MAG: acyl-CoA reductase [Candidatus Caenarcaniphilales bacterium]|nr:acyl-CoA reductase [Candidatus Caenarcaniphilales bacterium]
MTISPAHHILKEWLQVCLENLALNNPAEYALDLRSEWVPLLRTLTQYLQTTDYELVELSMRLKELMPAGQVLFVPASTVLITPITEICHSILREGDLTCRIPDSLPYSLYAKIIDYLPKSAPKVELLAWDSDDPHTTKEIMNQHDGVIVHGNDRTVETFCGLLSSQYFLGYGEKFSMLVLREPESRLDEIFEDLLAYRQLGCLSPHTICLLERSESETIDIARKLSAYLKKYPRLPGEAFLIRSWIEQEVLKKKDLSVFEDRILIDRTDDFMPTIGLGLVRLKLISSLKELFQLLDSLKDKLISIGNDLPDREKLALAEFFPDSRLCELGESQYPSLSWLQRPSISFKPLLSAS